ncbi:MAG: FAD:protein FMN transferase [Candidatus Omnitrophica bacterium]|nr:FAD:protein FMN transferase [Candidatus Omnitrophota bacterium]MDD5671930.1 FAD:protein FMN transferase [Candidatus Omnitrophota bacterium]
MQLRTFRILTISLVILLTATVPAGCFLHPVSHRKETVMGAANEIIIAGKNRAERERILKEAFKILHAIDGKMSLYQSSSEIARLNAKGFAEPQQVSPETFEVIEKSAEAYRETGGAFDITILPLMRLWGFYGKKHGVPAEEAIQQTLLLTGTNRLRLDPQNSKVGFSVPGMGIDLGGIAKGYACDKVVTYLKSQGIQCALVNIGGTVYALGLSPNGKPWRVGLRHPRDPGMVFQVLPLENQAVATSGDYAQFFIADGKRYAHILDPQTGYPARHLVSVSVIAPSATTADILSTALFVLGPAKVDLIANKFPGIRWYLAYLTGKDQLEMIEGPTADGSIKKTRI